MRTKIPIPTKKSDVVKSSLALQVNRNSLSNSTNTPNGLGSQMSFQFGVQNTIPQQREKTENDERKNSEIISPAKFGLSFSNVSVLPPAPIQAKLKVGQSDDEYEQEADRVADMVMRKSVMQVQRQPAEEDVKIRRQPESVKNPSLDRIAGMGLMGRSAPLKNREDYRSSFGDVVDTLKVFAGDMAQKACDTLETKAYSYEGNIVLGSPTADREIVDHEVYHAANQKRNRMDSSVSLVRATDSTIEREANLSAATKPMTLETHVYSKASVPRLSFYTKKTIGGKEFRVSDDENMAIRQDENHAARFTFYGSKYFYAEPGLIGISHATLQAQQSALSLSRVPGLTLTVNPGSPAVSGDTLSSPRFAGDAKLEAIMKKIRSEYIRIGSKGNAVTKIQQALVDAGHPLPKYGVDGIVGDETTTAIKSFQRAVGLTGKDVDGVVGPVTLGHLDRFFGGGSKPGIAPKILDRISARNVNTGTEGVSMEIVDDCGGAAKTVMMGARPGFSTVAPQGSNNVKGVYKVGGVEVETPVFMTSEQVRDYIMKKIMGKANVNDAMTEYWGKNAAERDLIDKEAGINQYAEVKTGESHSIVRGGAIGWNWHWGAVIMRSGGDGVTLENFAGSGKTAWDFQMYAAIGSKSFHMEQKKRLKPDFATPEYGHKPITVRIKPA